MPYGLRGFRAFCRLLVLEDGSMFRLAPFQAFLLGFYFAGVTELVILLPKKQGKTTLLAALALYHLLMVPSAKCFVGASSGEQATWLYDQAAGFVIRSGLERHAVPPMSHRDRVEYEGVFDVKQGIHRIRFEHGFVRIVPHDVRTTDGVIPTLALVDELHRHPTGALYTAFRQGLVGDAQMITISTPGATLDSPLGRLRARAREATSPERQGRRRTYRSADGSLVLVEYGLEDTDDPDDIRIVKQANPAPWRTVKALRQLRDSWSTTRGEWLRYVCGLWTVGDDPAITAGMWDRLAVDIGHVEEGEDVVLAPSVGHNAAVAIAALRPEGCVAVTVEHLEAQEGRSIRSRTEDLIVELCDLYAVEAVACDLRGFRRSVEILEARGVPVVEAPHTTPRLVEFSATLDALMAEGKLMHDGDPTTRAQMLAALKKTNESGERYVPSDAARAVIAVAAAVHHATALVEELYMILPRTGGVG